MEVSQSHIDRQVSDVEWFVGNRHVSSHQGYHYDDSTVFRPATRRTQHRGNAHS